MKKIHPSRAVIAFLHDVVMAALSFPIAVYLRYGSETAEVWSGEDLALMTAMFTAIAAAVFLSSRMYRGVWRYASVNDMLTLARAATITILIFLFLIFLVTRLNAVPRSTMVINWFVLMALLGGPRFAYRSYKDRRMIAKAGSAGVPVLLVGTGDECELFIRALRHPHAEYAPVGVVSAKGARVGRNIHGVDVLGTVEELESIVADLSQRDLKPQRLIITDPHLDGAIVRGLLDEADRLGLPLARSPRVTDLHHGVSDKLEVRPIAVEDLLGRPQNLLDREGLIQLIGGKRVLVTGAGGSIGSELVRQIADLRPSCLVLFEACEFNLYSIDMEITNAHPELTPGLGLIPVLGDIRDATRVNGVMAEHRPDLVFHAAALKHVPMVEYNPDEGVFTNAVGTRNVAEACRAHHVSLMVQISTDKAVNPTNVMGAAKRAAEMVAQSLDLADQGEGGTRYVTVRFGNVLGSNGSVVPLFQKQLQAGGPLTVTHPDMTRYFMTIREAVELVLQASALGRVSPLYRGKIFVLDMGEPVRIIDLATQMIRLAGLRPNQDVKITFTGLRPGEKLFEELFHGAEPPMPTERPGILVAAPRAVDLEDIRQTLTALEEDCRAHRVPEILARLRALVPEYQPSEGN